MKSAAEVVYLLSMLTSALCAILLFRGYRRSGTRLLMWSALCFTCLFANNVMLFLDLIVFGPQIDLSVWRLVPAAVGIALLCYGFIEEEA
jgi:hypothetical protein